MTTYRWHIVVQYFFAVLVLKYRFHLVGQLTNVHVVLPINQTRHLPSVSEEMFGSCCLIRTDELLMKSDNAQVALPNQPLLLELPSLLQSLLYRCDHHRSSPIISDHHWSSAWHLLSTSKKSKPYVNRETSISDFVGQAVFDGDPTALPGSEVEYWLKKINTEELYFSSVIWIMKYMIKRWETRYKGQPAGNA